MRIVEILNVDLEKELSVSEASGYIPSRAQQDDPRFKTALTVDVRPNTMKQQAKRMGLGNISRAGIPQLASASGKVNKNKRKQPWLAQ